MLGAAVLQLASLYAPAAHATLVGNVPFVRVPTAGPVLAALGAFTLAVAIWGRGRWRWIPGACSALVVAVVHWRLVHSPSATFADPLLRRLVHPSWGFWPMGASAAFALVAGFRRRA